MKSRARGAPVTYSGVTYVHITSTSSLSTAPNSDTTNWQPFQYEIWKSNGPNTASLPIYVKLVYATAGSNSIRALISIGTGVDASGNITNAVAINPNTPNGMINMHNSTSSSTTFGEMDFAGDADNFRFVAFRNAGALPSVNYFNLVLCDRSKTNAGVDTDAFVFVGTQIAPGGAQGTRSSILLNPTLGGSVLQSTSGWAGVVTCCGFSGSITMFGSSPALPIFPLVGFCAPPLLGAVGVHHNDYFSQRRILKCRSHSML